MDSFSIILTLLSNLTHNLALLLKNLKFTANFPFKWHPSPQNSPTANQNESNEVGTSGFFRLSLQTVRLTFVNTVKTADIQITGVSESCETERLNINTRIGGVFVEEPEKRKFCEKWGEILRRRRKKKRGEEES